MTRKSGMEPRSKVEYVRARIRLAVGGKKARHRASERRTNIKVKTDQNWQEPVCERNISRGRGLFYVPTQNSTQNWVTLNCNKLRFGTHRHGSLHTGLQSFAFKTIPRASCPRMKFRSTVRVGFCSSVWASRFFVKCVVLNNIGCQYWQNDGRENHT